MRQNGFGVTPLLTGLASCAEKTATLLSKGTRLLWSLINSAIHSLMTGRHLMKLAGLGAVSMQGTHIILAENSAVSTWRATKHVVPEACGNACPAGTLWHGPWV